MDWPESPPLAEWETKRLVDFYIGTFISVAEGSRLESNLEYITEILSLRPFKERLHFLHYLGRRQQEHVSCGQSRIATLYDMMRDHYHMHILD